MQFHHIVAVAFAFVHVIECGLVDKPGFDRAANLLSATAIKYSSESNQQYHLTDAMHFVERQTKKFSTLNENVAKNVILFLGDGMGVPVLAATRVYIGGEKESLSFEKFPFVGMSKTYCADQMVADSACSATGEIFVVVKMGKNHFLEIF